ncbi:MAG: 50S ribosomal protein L24 [Christensenellales bacterium]
METKKLHIKKGDQVMVISGDQKDKKVGKVLKALPREGKVIIEGINVSVKHKKPHSAKEQGGRIKQESAIAASKVMLYCNKCKNPTRISIKVLDDGSKVRVCKKCGETFNK